MKHVALFVLLFNRVLCAVLTVTEFWAEIVPNSAGKISNEYLKKIVETGTKSQCVLECVYLHECLSFFYKHETGDCRLHGSSWTVTAKGLHEGPGYNYYRIRGGMIDDRCSAQEDCTVQNSECRSEKICGCLAGYSFLPEDQTCVADCAQYGTTFQYFEHKNHFGKDEFVGRFSSLDECFSFCIAATTFSCVAFLRYEGKCYFQSVDVSDLPSKYRTFNNCYYYQRNCA